jgi:hypothetical protein
VNAERRSFISGSFWSPGMSAPMRRTRLPCCARCVQQGERPGERARDYEKRSSAAAAGSPSVSPPSFYTSRKSPLLPMPRYVYILQGKSLIRLATCSSNSIATLHRRVVYAIGQALLPRCPLCARNFTRNSRRNLWRSKINRSFTQPWRYNGPRERRR